MASAKALLASTVSAQNQMNFQREMSNTAHVREVRDLQNAGLNPVLSAKLGGASTPSGASGDYSDPMTGALMASLRTAQMAVSSNGKAMSDAAGIIESAIKSGYEGLKGLMKGNVIDNADGIMDFVLGKTDAKGLTGALYDLANLVTVRPDGLLNRLFFNRGSPFASANNKNGIPLGDFINAVVNGFSDASASDRKARGAKWDSNYKNARTWEILRSLAGGYDYSPRVWRALASKKWSGPAYTNHNSVGSYLYGQKHVGKEGWKNDRPNAYARRLSNRRETK